METILNIPIQMISACSTQGKITPLRFRYEDEEHAIKAIDIQETLCSTEINFSGIKALSFTCKATIYERESLFELRYTFLTHTWVLFRILY